MTHIFPENATFFLPLSVKSCNEIKNVAESLRKRLPFIGYPGCY